MRYGVITNPLIRSPLILTSCPRHPSDGLGGCLPGIFQTMKYKNPGFCRDYFIMK